jgi:hypothetical protein
MTGQCGYNNNNNNNNNKNNSLNSVIEQFTNNNDTANNNTEECPYPTSPEGFSGYVLDFGKKLLTNAGLFGIIFVILFVRQNYFDPKSLPSILAFVGIVSALFAVLQYLYPDMNGFIIAGVGVSVGMAMFKDQFSTVFINNSSAKLS